MSYPVYHGIQLAQSSEIHNLNVQKLAQVAIDAITNGNAGRIVFDTDSQSYKYWKTDDNGAIVTEEITSLTVHNTLQALVDVINGDGTTEGSFRKAIADVVGTTPESLDTLQEIATALNNDPDLYNTITALISSNIEAAKTEIRGAVSENFDTLEEIEVKLNDLSGSTTTGLAAETDDRIAGDLALQTELDATQVGAGLGNDGSYTVDTAANFISAASSLRDADLKLDTSLQTEKDRALAAEAALEGRISDVENAAGGGKIGDLTTLHTDAKDSLVNATNEVHDDVVAEKTRAEGVEATLDGKINQAIADRKAQDDVIEASLGLEADGSFDGTKWIDASQGSWQYFSPAPAQSLKQLIVNLDRDIGLNQDSISYVSNDIFQTKSDLQMSVGLNGDLSYAPDTASNFIATATSVADATTRLDSQIKLNTDDIAAEVSARTTAIVTIQAELDTTKTGAGLETDGTYAAKADANYIAAATSLKGADEALDAAVKAEVDRSTAEDNAIKSRVDALEAQDAGTNIGDMTTLTTDAKDNLVNAVNEVDAQQGSIATAVGLTETPAAGGSNFSIDLTSTNYVNGATTVQGAIVGLDTQVKTIDDAHKASWFTYKSTAGAATNHLVQHNLNAEFVEVQLWVKSPDDGKYRMDIAEVIEHDFNSIEVVMNAARDIKVIVEKRYA